MHDPIKIALWLGGASLLVGLGCAVYIVTANGSSRNIALGFGAVFGACAVFLVQLYFELQPSSTTDDFPIEFTTDFQSQGIRSRVQARGYRNIFTEAEASTVLAATTPALRAQDAPRITRDLGVLSVLAYLLEEQFDWQLNAVVYKTSSGVISMAEPMSSVLECTTFTDSQLQEQLAKAGNMFAHVKRFGLRSSFCLPPNSLLEITSNSVILTNRVCKVSFVLREPFSMQSSTDPHDNSSTNMPLLPDGSPRYSTVVIGARVTTDYLPLRAQARDLPKYQAWAKHFAEGLRVRFGATP